MPVRGHARRRSQPRCRAASFTREALRAMLPGDKLDDEEPMLLDPSATADPGHLWFDEDGQAVPNPICGKPSSHPCRRAENSRRFFHLNHPGIVDQRKALCSEIRRRVEDADGYFKKYSDGDATARGAFSPAVRDLVFTPRNILPRPRKLLLQRATCGSQ